MLSESESRDRQFRVDSRTPGHRRPPLRGSLLPAGFFVLLVLTVYADPLFFRRNFGGRDLLAYNLPMERAVHDAYSRGRLPVWISEISGGRPLLPNPNAGALYPARPLLALFPFVFAMRIFPVLHWILAGLGMFALTRLLGASRSGAWIGAVTYAFSGVAVSEVFFPHILPGLALLPWIVWAFARTWNNSWGKLFALSVLFALEMLAGDVFSIGLAIVCGSLWILFEERPPAWGRGFALLAGSLLVAALGSAPQIVATALWIPETGRAVTGMKLSESLLFSVTPFRLLELVVPYPFGPTFALEVPQFWMQTVFRGKAIGLFTTLYPGAFAVIAAWSLRRDKARGVRFGRALALASLSFAVLPSLLPSALGKLPSPLPLRNPEKFAVGVSLGLAILAGVAFDRLREKPLRSGALLAVAGSLGLISAAAWIWTEPAGRIAMRLVGQHAGSAHLAGGKLAVAFAEGGLLWIGTVIALEAARSLPRAGPAIGIALLTMVPVAANRRIARTFPEEAIFAPTAFARFLLRADPHGEYRVIGVSEYRVPSPLQEAAVAAEPGLIEYSRRQWTSYFPALWGRGLVFNNDFDKGDLSRMQSLRRFSFAASGYRDSQAFFGMLALRWGVRYRDQEPLPGYSRIGGNGLMDWDGHEKAYPDIRLLTAWREEPDAVAALKAVPRLSAGEVVIESGRSGPGSVRPGRLIVFEKSPERLRLGVEAPEPTWLFVLRGFWKHRTILLDGSPVEDAPAQLAFSAIRVPAGRHTVEWRELLPGWAISRWGPVLFTIALVGILALGLRGFPRMAVPPDESRLSSEASR